jgi:hypothetical protein
MFVVVYAALTWLYNALDLSRRDTRCNTGTVEQLFTPCKAVTPSGTQ